MNKRMIGMTGLIACGFIGYWAWENLGAGGGITNNVVRNMIIGAVAPIGLYCLLMLLASDEELRSVYEKKPDDEPQIPDDIVIPAKLSDKQIQAIDNLEKKVKKAYKVGMAISILSAILIVTLLLVSPLVTIILPFIFLVMGLYLIKQSVNGKKS